MELKKISEAHLNIIRAIIHKNRILDRLMAEQKTAIRNTSDGVLNYF